MAEKEPTIKDLKEEQVKLRKRVELYGKRTLRFHDLEILEKQITEMDARIAKLEKA